MKLIVGLGNPGNKYEKTRHNIGFRVLDFLADEFSVSFQNSKYRGELATVADSDHDKIFLLKPQTFMNLSGESIQSLSRFFKIPNEDILVVYDEVDLPFGRIRFAGKGGSAGHNGIKSVISCLGGQNFPRLRIGVGRPKHPGQEVADYVLQKFASDEEGQIPEIIQKSAEGIQYFLKTNITETMNEFNGN